VPAGRWAARITVTGMSTSAYRSIERLIYTYAELVDAGDFGGVGDLLADATFIGAGVPVVGRDAIAEGFAETVIRYADGTPGTKHLITNIVIDLAEDGGSASSRCYFTALQALPGLPLQPIASGRYRDRFALGDGCWHFNRTGRDRRPGRRPQPAHQPPR
jgi:hypothetical protein